MEASEPLVQLDLMDTQNGDAPESEQSEPSENVDSQSDGLLSQDKMEVSERVAYLEKRVREQEDEIVCLKGTLADVMRRLVHVETSKSQNSILPSKPQMRSPRRAPTGAERPRSVVESYTPRNNAPTSSRPTPRGGSAGMGSKKWNSMSNNIEETNGHKSTRHHSSSLSHSKRSSSYSSLQIKTTRGIKEPTWNEVEKYVRMHLKGRPVPLYAPKDTDGYDVQAAQEPPAKKLELEWVYGYRGRDGRSNLYMLPTGEAIYFTAAVVVLHNFEEQTQRHYTEHTDDIKCIAINPFNNQVATGQVAGHEKKEGKPHVRVWETIKLETLYILGEGDFQRGVCCVDFSKTDGGKMLLAVDEGNDHTLSVWDVSREKSAKKITEMKASGDPVTQCDFHPIEENSIVCCGKSQITFWTIGEDKKLVKKAGIFEKNEKPKVVICFTFMDNGDVVSGDSSGNIYVWAKGETRISQAVKDAHEGGVFSLCVVKDGYLLSGGGKDRRIVKWDSNFEKQGETTLEEDWGAVRMISKGSGSSLLVGTIRNCILQGTQDLQFQPPVVEGHKEELWGLDTNPKTHQFLTCGYDGYIYCWDTQTHECVWSKRTKYNAHCCSIHPTHDVAAIGMQSGKWILLDLNTHEILTVCEDGKEQHECIQFSPDGEKLAVGCRDNYIYVYDVKDNGKKYSKIGRCSGHSSFLTHIDWSENGEVIRSNSGDYEVLYWNSKTCKQETDKDDVQDLKWATQNCTLSFNAIGCWPDGADGTDVNNCGVSNDNTLLVSADDYGKVNLYHYPSIQPRATGHSYGGHSSHVTMAKFLFDDSRVISTGGRDNTVLQWQVV